MCNLMSKSYDVFSVNEDRRSPSGQWYDSYSLVALQHDFGRYRTYTLYSGAVLPDGNAKKVGMS